MGHWLTRRLIWHRLKYGLSCFILCLYKTAKVENLFGDADDISSVSSHEEGDRAEADMVCRNFALAIYI